MEERKSITIFDGKEYILSNEELSKHKNRAELETDNFRCFYKDLVSEDLISIYGGTFVAYQKGILCGQSKNRDLLKDIAKCYYGSSSLSVFLVPEEGASLEIQNIQSLQEKF